MKREEIDKLTKERDELNIKMKDPFINPVDFRRLREVNDILSSTRPRQEIKQETKPEIEPIIFKEAKVTKEVLNKFITWSTSRYNNYCGYGTKKENVNIVFNSLKNGYYTDGGKEDPEKKIFVIICANSVGENGNGRYWRTKQGGDEYTIDCMNRTIIAKYSKRILQFE
jgi:hypothetical protein